MKKLILILLLVLLVAGCTNKTPNCPRDIRHQLCKNPSALYDPMPFHHNQTIYKYKCTSAQGIQREYFITLNSTCKPNDLE